MEEVWWRNRCGRKDNVAKSLLNDRSRVFASCDSKLRFLGYQVSREVHTSLASSSKALYQCNSSENEHHDAEYHRCYKFGCHGGEWYERCVVEQDRGVRQLVYGGCTDSH